MPVCPGKVWPVNKNRKTCKPDEVALVSCSQAAADTLAISSLEVDLSNVEEGSTVTVKWRGKPVFIKHRTDADIADSASVLMKDLKDPQTDADRTVDPKVRIEMLFNLK